MQELAIFSDSKEGGPRHYYSVDMMFAYVNTRKHPIVEISLDILKPLLDNPTWDGHSPMDVIKNMNAKKYSVDAEHIHKSNLAYPIMLMETPKYLIAKGYYKYTVMDGYHRLSKAYLQNKTKIKAYVFSGPLLKKFTVKMDPVPTIYDIIELWNKRFCS